MEWLYIAAVLAVPMLLGGALVALVLRGPWRWAAMIPLAALALAWSLDAYSASRRGNLTGLFTIIAAVPCLVLLLLICLARGATSLWRQRATGSTAGQPEEHEGGRQSEA